MNADLKRFTFLIAFRDGTTRTETYTDTDAGSARESRSDRPASG